MGLETGDFIGDLVLTNPITSTDPVTEGAAHIRLLKKTIQQSFPNVDDEVLLTPDEFNALTDAALKSVPQTISGVWTHSANIALENTIALRGTLADTVTTRQLLTITASDVIQLGGTALELSLQGITQAEVAIGADDVARFLPRASGSLSLSDGAGAFTEALRAGGGQTIAGQMIFESDIRLENNVSLVGRNFADDGNIEIAKVNVGDNVRFGSAAENTFINGGQVIFEDDDTAVAKTRSIASGSFETADPVGVFTPVLREGGGQTVTANFTVANNIPYRAELFGGSPVHLVRLDASDVCRIGAVTQRTRIDSIDFLQFFMNSVQVAQTTTRALGSLLVADSSGNLKKAGFRNPHRSEPTGSFTLTQSFEGRIVNPSTASSTITVPVLEIETTMRILTRSAGPFTLVADGGAELRFMTGDGGNGIVGTSLNIPRNSCVELFWYSTTSVQVFGNGLTVNP